VTGKGGTKGTQGTENDCISHSFIPHQHTMKQSHMASCKNIYHNFRNTIP